MRSWYSKDHVLILVLPRIGSLLIKFLVHYICLKFFPTIFPTLSVFPYCHSIILKIRLPFYKNVSLHGCALTMPDYNVFLRSFVQMQIRTIHHNIVETSGISLHSNHIATDKLMPVWLFLGSSLLKMVMIVTYKRHETMTKDLCDSLQRSLVILIWESDAQLPVQIKNT